MGYVKSKSIDIIQPNDKCYHYICQQQADIAVHDIFKVLAHLFHNKAKNLFRRAKLRVIPSHLLIPLEEYLNDSQVYY